MSVIRTGIDVKLAIPCDLILVDMALHLHRHTDLPAQCTIRKSHLYQGNSRNVICTCFKEGV